MIENTMDVLLLSANVAFIILKLASLGEMNEELRQTKIGLSAACCLLFQVLVVNLFVIYFVVNSIYSYFKKPVPKKELKFTSAISSDPTARLDSQQRANIRNEVEIAGSDKIAFKTFTRNPSTIKILPRSNFSSNKIISRTKDLILPPKQ